QYLELFDEVRPIARVYDAPTPPANWQRVDGPGVRFAPLRHYQGLGAMLRALPRTLLDIGRHLRTGDAFAFRGSGGVCTLAWLWLALRRAPYAWQVVGHTGEGVRMGAPLPGERWRRVVADASWRLTRRQVGGACTAAYVSDHLRRLCPLRTRGPTFLFSDVNLAPELITAPRAAAAFCADPLRVVSVGRMNSEKGYDVLLEAVRRLSDRGERRWALDVIGSGPELDSLRRRTAELDLAANVSFSGWLAWGPELFARLDHADLYVLPSRTEGLPRALLEAMARGLPALGTRVGGVPDLLAERDLLTPGDAEALARRIGALIGDRATLAEMSRAAFEAAERFHPAKMRAQKLAYWSYLRARSERRRPRR
ncbi:MAG: glycosyltransferase, partial [Phycisphaerae bacterium]